MNSLDYLDEINNEREYRIKGRSIPDPNAILLWNRAINDIQSSEKKETLIDAFNFAKGIKYEHEGLTGDIYFAHPVRVAALSLLSQERVSIDFGIIGLLHNIFELSDISFDLNLNWTSLPEASSVLVASKQCDMIPENIYFPIQNLEKTESRTSSILTLPIISFNA